MESKIARSLNLKYHPVAILWSDDRPEKAMGSTLRIASLI